MSIEAALNQAHEVLNCHHIQQRQEVIDDLIGRIRCMLSIGLSGKEIQEHLQGYEPELVFLAYQGAKLLVEDVEG